MKASKARPTAKSASPRIAKVARSIIDVTDNGSGIPQKARENLFKAFQASTKKGGTGLGLVIAAELVQAHGGTLTLVDDTKAAHFRIELPDRSAN